MISPFHVNIGSDLLLIRHRIELLSLGVTAEALQANIDWKSAFLLEEGQFGPKFQVQRAVPHQPFFCCKTEVLVLSRSVKSLSRSFFFIWSQLTLLSDGQTGGRLHHG